MCAEFEIKFKVEELLKQDKHLIADANIEFNQQVFPWQMAPVIIASAHNHVLTSMRFCLIPSWSKVEKPQFTTYNARLDRLNAQEQIEYIYQAPAWRTSFHSKRCIVPLSAFVEACSSENGTFAGNIVRFSPKAKQVLYAAGIYETWTNPLTGKVVPSFAIITDDPTNYIREVGHDRMPVLLQTKDVTTWLNTNALPVIAAYKFLKTNQAKIDFVVEKIKPLTSYAQLKLF